MNKNHEKILDDSGLQDFSLTSRISPIAIMVWKLQKSQDNTAVVDAKADLQTQRANTQFKR